MKKILTAALIFFSLFSNSKLLAHCTRTITKSQYANFGAEMMPISAVLFPILFKDPVGLSYVVPMTKSVDEINTHLSRTIPIRRPCGCPEAFPSGHTTLMAGSASFVYHRYSPKFGLPAYALSIAFMHDRVTRCKAHSWRDVLLTAGIMHSLGYLFVKKFDPKHKNDKLQIIFTPHSAGIRLWL